MDGSIARPVTKESFPGFKEFVALIATMMALNAMSIDSMLPALPEISRSFGLDGDNQRQWILTSYMLGFGGAQLIWGSLADRFGRRRILLLGLVGYVLCTIMVATAGSFAILIAARVLQGVASASTRVLAISIVRDRYSGRQMAKVMSLAFMVFMVVPIFAPSFGQVILLFAPWRWLFGLLAIYGLVTLVWTGMRLPETLQPEYRIPIEKKRLLFAARIVLSERTSIGYCLALTFMFGSLFGFVNSVQQIFYDVFHAPDIFPLVFAGAATSMAVASLINSRIVEKFGTRKVSHVAVLGFILIGLFHTILAIAGADTLWVFFIFQAAIMMCFGFSSANFGAMAMESVGKIAGTAASVQGFISTTGAALIGMAIGQSFDGTTIPITLGYTLCGIASLTAVLITEKGKLFRPHHEPAH
jgi:DHA1 family bicyclomycin/chloramphenicol resistance-like MFS transporter